MRNLRHANKTGRRHLEALPRLRSEADQFGSVDCSMGATKTRMTAETEACLLYERMSRAERQRVLDTLGRLFGYPFRPYTQEEWLEAIVECF